MITPYNLLRHGLIGLEARVVDSTHEEYKKISGKIVDETQKTLEVEDKQNTIKKIMKNQVKIEITLPSKTVVRVDGSLLAGKPEERIKKRHRIVF